MSASREKVVVAMSGGVDSSVAACLLVEQGYDVMGLFMRTGVKEPERAADVSPREDPEVDRVPMTGETPRPRSRLHVAPMTSDSSRGLKPAAQEAESPRGLKSAAQETEGPRGLKPAARSDRHRGCCSASDAADARFVAGMLGIPFYVLNFEKEFDSLIDYFADEYARGRTPNPCVVCNDRLKFGRIVEYADAVGAKYIATGHYARIGQRPSHVAHGASRGEHEREGASQPHRGDTVSPESFRPYGALRNEVNPETPRLTPWAIGCTVTYASNFRLRPRAAGDPCPYPVLMRAADAKKDQSYVLFGLDRAILDRVMFPVGHLQKSEVRRIAERFNLPNRDKPDSVEICFAPDRDYAKVVRERRPDAFVSGDVLGDDGTVIGRHGGIGQYTIGQRRGLGIAAGKPVYVTKLDVLNNAVTLGDGDALLADGLIADRASFLVDLPDEPFRAAVKIRYLHQAAAATVERIDAARVRVTFEQPQRAITPGQAVVFYAGDVVLGGAWIDQAECSREVRTRNDPPKRAATFTSGGAAVG